MPVFADIGPDYNLDPARVRESISRRTRAVIPVHFGGRPADMDALGDIAAEHKLRIIEDAAHAHGASWKGRPAGSFGSLASFSFQQSKNLTAGEGGIVIGSDYRMTAWQAAILLVQLSRLFKQLERRSQNARHLDRRLAEFDVLDMQPADPRVTRHSYYLYMIRIVPERLSGISRDLFVKALAAEGVPGIGGYPYPLYGNQVFDERNHRRGDCPEAERMCRDTFWVSHEIMLAEPEDLSDFVRAVAKVAESSAELVRSQEVSQLA
jgi:dTDP-4-amino-4,6-dideoxygalactose transaminase